MRNQLTSALAITVVSFAGSMLAATAAFAESYPPEVTTTLPEETTSTAASGAVVPEDPGADVDSEVVVAVDSELPGTGSDSNFTLQIGAAVVVAGLTAVVIARRRRPAPAV
jgi:LPXTG-motif cell wall-anchored protein